jgi:hypothetical protein
VTPPCPPPASARLAELHHEREQLETQLKALDKTSPAAADPALLDQLPPAGDILPGLPPALKARLLAGFDIEVLWNKDGQQATVQAEITENTLRAVAGILDPGQDGYRDASAATSTDDPAPMGHLISTPRGMLAGPHISPGELIRRLKVDAVCSLCPRAARRAPDVTAVTVPDASGDAAGDVVVVTFSTLECVGCNNHASMAVRAGARDADVAGGTPIRPGRRMDPSPRKARGQPAAGGGVSRRRLRLRRSAGGGPA